MRSKQNSKPETSNGNTSARDALPAEGVADPTLVASVMNSQPHLLHAFEECSGEMVYSTEVFVYDAKGNPLDLTMIERTERVELFERWHEGQDGRSLRLKSGRAVAIIVHEDEELNEEVEGDSDELSGGAPPAPNDARRHIGKRLKRRR